MRAAIIVTLEFAMDRPVWARRFQLATTRYSRVGFAHEFRALTRGETCQVLHEQLLTSNRPSFPNGWSANDEGTAAIIRITSGNFRLMDRLMSQIGRILVQSLTPSL